MTTKPFPKEGLVRLSQVLGPDGPIPVSKSAWHLGVRAGIYPQPIRLGPRTTCYDARAIRALYEAE